MEVIEAGDKKAVSGLGAKLGIELFLMESEFSPKRIVAIDIIKKLDL